VIRRALVACAVLLAGAAPPTVQPIPTVAAAPLPATRLEFGLSNLDIDWMKNSGVPWGYRFQYLAGGVNTTGNWLTWQDMALPPGQFAVDYMASSTTAPANYIPVFTWYQLLQSLPSTGASELDRDYSNLNNASTMSSYYSSFKILMQKAGAYGRQVVVHVEPDFWGYMQQKAEGGAASSVSARVRSSGFAEAAAFPDNLVGFASELKYLRDTYAPDALLAVDRSNDEARAQLERIHELRREQAEGSSAVPGAVAAAGEAMAAEEAAPVPHLDAVEPETSVVDEPAAPPAAFEVTPEPPTAADAGAVYPDERRVRRAPAVALRVLEFGPEARGIDQELLRHAAADHAGAADAILLGDHHAGAVARRDAGGPHAARSRADDEQIDLFRHSIRLVW